MIKINTTPREELLNLSDTRLPPFIYSPQTFYKTSASHQ